MIKVSLWIALALPLVCMATVAAAQGPGNGDDEVAIKNVIVQMTEGFNRREAAEKTLRRIFETRAKTAALKTEEVQIRFIRPDVALAHVTNELSGLVAADGQNLPSHRELSLRVFVKDDGVWRLASFQNTMLNPFPGASPASSKP